jgi:hypothetical protein
VNSVGDRSIRHLQCLPSGSANFSSACPGRGSKLRSACT